MFQLRIRVGTLKREDKRKIEGLVRACQEYEEIYSDLDTDSEEEDDVWGMLYHDSVLVCVVYAARVEENIIELQGFTKPGYRENHCFSRVLGRVIRHMTKNGLLDLETDSVLIPVEGSEDAEALMAAWQFPIAYHEYILAHPTITGWQPQNTIRIEETHDQELLTRLHSVIFSLDIEASRWFVGEMLQDATVKAYVMYQKNEAVGMYFLMQEMDTSFFLCGFGVLPLYRRKGIATQALDAMLCDCAQQADEIGLQVSDLEEEAFALYTNYGFTDRRISTYYELPKEKMMEYLKYR